MNEATGINLSVEGSTGAPGELVTVPILIDDATDVVSLNLLLTYDTTLLSIPDPNTETEENEGVRRAGISENWVFTDPDLNDLNPVANVNQETGEVSISLVKTDTEPTQGSGRILEIDFLIAEDAELGSTTSIDLQPSRRDDTSRIGIGNEDLLLTESVLTDDDITVGDSSNTIEDSSNTIELFRFRNTTFDTGTYVFVGEAERDAILANPDFNQTFELEGDGNPAFVASTVSGDDLEGFFRLSSLDNPGTFLFVGQGEYDAIFAPDSDQRDRWEQQGFDTDGTTDIPEFYLYGVGAGLGTQFNRFQNRANNTFLYAGPDETAAINNDPNFSAVFFDQGAAFESLN
ncbi:MAG: cohesin domain-containing protein [Xenococcaceae cyanobacterium MO_167.B27]|nr:cohesin domain-containing protein [Xenococcaceae cyanobacterium MO_167.B27]